jgi:hypothetical protein
MNLRLRTALCMAPAAAMLAIGCTNVRCVLPEHTSAELGPVTRMLDSGTLYLRAGDAFLVDGVRVTADSVLVRNAEAIGGTADDGTRAWARDEVYRVTYRKRGIGAVQGGLIGAVVTGLAVSGAVFLAREAGDEDSFLDDPETSVSIATGGAIIGAVLGYNASAVRELDFDCP